MDKAMLQCNHPDERLYRAYVGKIGDDTTLTTLKIMSKCIHVGLTFDGYEYNPVEWDSIKLSNEDE